MYDHLRIETSGGANDRRTAIDIISIRSNMDAQGATVRWVYHSRMNVGAMTKKKAMSTDSDVHAKKAHLHV